MKTDFASTLTAEAGLNADAAFPLVMLGLGLLGLHELGTGTRRWWAKLRAPATNWRTWLNLARFVGFVLVGA
jgi:hypothetical protein